MQKLAWIALILGLAYLGAANLSPMARYHAYPVEVLESELHPPAELNMIPKSSADQVWLRAEIWRKKFSLDRWVTFLLSLGLLGTLLPAVLSLGGGGRSQSKRKSAVEETFPDAPPKEVYVDEIEFQRKIEGGYKRREDAAAWLLDDPLRRCDYCGADLRATFQGERESVQLVTFYKKAPEGAKDLRIVLGTFWFPKPASELKCTSCDRVVRR